MAAHKHINKICCVVIAACIILTALFMGGEAWGLQKASAAPGYEGRLFDNSQMHTIDIVMDDWEGFLETCENEEYAVCSVVIDNEVRKNVGIRAKGNTSLTQVAQYGNDRYSFKIEFDHYDSTQSYYGLDKLSLNNLIQDNTCMKDYLVYQLMGAFGVPSPLCSYAYITVNGEDWGLYLAIEGVEDAFLQRNFGSDTGELYKPDSMDMGGGRGNGGGFDMADWQEGREDFQPEGLPNEMQGGMPGEMPGEMPGNMPDNIPDGMEPGGGQGFSGGGPGGMGADDVSLIYTDDDFDSYQNIFDNAKTDVTDADKKRLIEALRRLGEQEDLDNTLFTEDVLRYFVVHNFVCNFDSYTGSMIHNYYLYEKDGQLAMIPWDYNLAFGGFMGTQSAQAMVNYPIDTPVSGGTIDSRPMLAWIFSDETYTQQYHALFSEFMAQLFDSGACEEIIANAKALIAPYVEKDPTKFCTYEEFETGTAALQEFCSLRAESIRGQLADTVPSTQETQAQQPDALVDAGDLNLSDMGSMQNGGMGGRGGQREEFTPNQDGNAEEENPVPELPQDGGEPPNMEERQRPGQPGQASQENPTGNWVLLGASAAVLAIGLGIAFGYKKKV